MVVGDVTTAVDVLVLGGGPGGYVAAIRAAQLGRSVEIIHAEPPGGTCLYRGCIPLKSLLAASRRYYEARPENLEALGIKVPGPVSFDFSKMQNWKEGVVKKLGNGVQQLLSGNRIEQLNGKAWFIGPNEVRAEAEYGLHRISFESCVIAVGTESISLPELPFDGQRVLSPEAALALAELPPALSIFGEDYIALEFATLFARLGVAVTLLLPGERPLPEIDQAAVRLVQAGLRKLGVQTVSNVQIGGLTESELRYNSGKGEQTAPLPLVVSNGGRARTADLDLNAAGLKTDAAGFIQVNSSQQTAHSKIWAAGNCTGQANLAADAIKQGKVAAENLAGRRVQYAPQARPIVVHTSPELAAVGYSAEAATRAGYQIVTGRFQLGANGKALTLGADLGVALVIAEAGTEVLLGVTFVGPGAGEVIGEAALAIEMGATLTDLSEILHAHPGLNEALGESADAALNQAIHLLATPAAIR
jgi:dihydrolipoamide dehydrogenase